MVNSKKKLFFVGILSLFFTAPFLIGVSKGSPVFENEYQQFKTHINPNEGYSVNFPASWFVQEPAGSGAILTISNYDISKPVPDLATDAFAVDVVTLKNPDRLSLNSFLEWHDKNNYEGTGVTTQVHSVSPIHVSGREGRIREITTLVTVWEAIIADEDRIFLLAGRKDSKFETLFNEILYSFRVISDEQ